jgi:hypothetical protein
MAAFNRRKINDFEFKEIARSIDEIHQSIRFDFETALIRSPARSRLLLPCQCVPLQNEIPLLFLNIDVTQLSMMQGGFRPSFSSRASGRCSGNVIVNMAVYLFEKQTAMLHEISLAPRTIVWRRSACCTAITSHLKSDASDEFTANDISVSTASAFVVR